MRHAVLLPLAVAAALLNGCAGASVERAAAPSPSASPSPSPSPSPAPEPRPEPSPSWVVGASPLPLRPDGFGQVLDTPAVLRDRRMTSVSTLPPPRDGRFAATVGAVTPAIRQRMGQTWSEACPVGLDGLRYLTVSFRGFDRAAHTGELIVNATVAEDVVQVFRALFAAGFPIEEMRLPTTADLTAPPTGDGNNTAGLVCRASRGQRTWSQHAYGLAVDVNPFHNPMVKRDLVLPELAGAYEDRAAVRPGMHLPGGPSVRAFAGIGWKWGGDWRSSKDYMHFSQNGG